jgi:ABC-type transport system involved in cytochrome c biogenesis permease component
MTSITALTHTVALTSRHLRAAWRIPVFLVMNLVQPMIWLLLFGQLFRSVVDIPGFARGGTYLEFLTPGIVMMMALFASAWAGTTYIQDMDRGVMDRLLTSPTSRGALMVSRLIYQAALTVGHTLIVLGVAWLFGARFGGGPGGLAALLLAAILLTAVFSALSNAAALLARNQRVLIGISQLNHDPAHVPELGPHGHQGVCRLGVRCRRLQPLRVGGHRRSRRDAGKPRLDNHLGAPRSARGTGRSDGLGGHANLPRLSALDLTPASEGQRRLIWSGGIFERSTRLYRVR